MAAHSCGYLYFRCSKREENKSCPGCGAVRHRLPGVLVCAPPGALRPGEKECLAALDLIMDCPIETAAPDREPVERILFTQPEIRYGQAQALVHGDDEKYALTERQGFSRVPLPVSGGGNGDQTRAVTFHGTSDRVPRRFQHLRLRPRSYPGGRHPESVR